MIPTDKVIETTGVPGTRPEKVQSGASRNGSSCPPASRVIYEKSRLLELISKERGRIRESIESLVRQRDRLVREFEENHLKVKACRHENTAFDLFEEDDAKKRIDSVLRIQVETDGDVRRAIFLAKTHRLGVMAIGSRTSALGVFEANSLAELKGLDGVIGLEMPVCVPGPHAAGLLTVDESASPEGFELIRSPDLPVAVWKSSRFPAVPHRVVAHATASVGQINAFLNEALADRRFCFQIMPDPTSKAEATLGGVIACGAEGGNRASAAEDILHLKLIDADGGVHNLDRTEARPIVGLNGLAGVCMEAEFEVTALPGGSFGVMILVKGKDARESWGNALRIQSALSKYSDLRGGGSNRLPVSEEDEVLINAVEIMAAKEVRSSMKKHPSAADPEMNRLLESGSGLFIYVRGHSFYDMSTPEAIMENFERFFKLAFWRDLGLEIDRDREGEEFVESVFAALEEGQESVYRVPPDRATTHDRFFLFSQKKIFIALDEMRHLAATLAREEANTFGGLSQSLDFNIRFTSADERENAAAREVVSAIYADYVDRYTHDDSFEVAVYGHLLNGVGVRGGGLDPHIRITFKSNHPNSRYSAPEKLMEMKKETELFYTRLLDLDGWSGVRIERPEKSLLTNQTFLKEFYLKNPEAGFKVQSAIHAYGTAANGLRIFSFRAPFELPDDSVGPGIESVLNGDSIVPGPANGRWIEKYWPAVLEISEMSHRSPEVKRMLGEVVRSVRRAFAVPADRYPFFIDRPEEAEGIIARNLGDGHGFRIRRTAVAAAGPLDWSDADAFDVLDLGPLGLPRGLALLVAPHRAIRVAAERDLTAENRAEFRNLFAMWKYHPYETEETPNLPAIALLGILLERDRLERGPFVSKIRKKTLNPGPSEIDANLKRDYLHYLSNAIEMSPNLQRKIIADFKKYLGMPADSAMAFAGSSTQMMQLLADALARKAGQLNLIQVVNDAFGERLNGVLVKTGNSVRKIATPWTTSECSEIARVTREILARWDAGKKNIIFLTPHKTSTTASFDPAVVEQALAAAGRKNGADYELVCDITSGVGAVDYRDPGTGTITLGCIFGSVQKALGCPPGLGFAAFSRSFLETLFDGDPGAADGAFSLKKIIAEAGRGEADNRLHLGILGHKLQADAHRGARIEDSVREIREKYEIVLAFLEINPDLLIQVGDSDDRSPVLMGIYSQTKNLVIAKRILGKLFGYVLGSGYGVFGKESVRLYLANVSKDDLRRILAAWHCVLEMPDVSHSTDKSAPVVTLREPMNPLNALEKLSRRLSPDDVFENANGLHWIGRLIDTYNANVEKTKKIKVNGVIPEITREFRKKARIYGDEKNLEEMRKILRMQDAEDHGHKSLVAYYESYHELEKALRTMLEANPDAPMSDHLQALVEEMKRHLARIVVLLNEHLEHCGRIDGRVAWPIVA
ncbi:MAG: hypothetical protein ACYDH0_04665 [Candidatus Aminicenantales bacterium]